MESETIDSLRVHVRRGLDRFCLGQYFTEYGLQENAKLIPDDINTDDLEASGLMDKKCPFQIFLKAVASEIVKEKGVTKGRKKRIKDYLEILQAFSSEWVDYIRKNMRKKKQSSALKHSGMSSPDHHPGGGSADPLSSPIKKKGGKRGPRGPYKKRKHAAAAAAAAAAASSGSPGTAGSAVGGAGGSGDYTSNKRQKMMNQQHLHQQSSHQKPKVVDIETARREFEAERDKVMSKVPTKNKKLFNQVGFAKWGKSNLPAMVLDPFSVPPGDIRDQWRKMFDNVVEKDRISKMGHLVWWIGPQTDGQSSYSVVPNHGFMTYEEGAARNMHELPAKIKKAIDRGSELNKTQMETVEALRILNELALQSKEEREHPRSDFVEEDYWGIDDDDEEEDEVEAEEPLVDEDKEVMDDEDDDDDDEELLDDDEDLMDSSLEESTNKKSSKKKKGKKRKKDQIIVEDEDHTEIVYDDIEEAYPIKAAAATTGPPKKKKKKDKTKKKKKKSSMDGGSGGGETGAAGLAEGGDDSEDHPQQQQQQQSTSAAASALDDFAAIPRKPKPAVTSSDVAAAAAATAVRAPTPDMDDPSDSADSALVDSDYGGDEFGEGGSDGQLMDDDDPTTTSSTTGKKKNKKTKTGSKKNKDKSLKEEKEEKKGKKKKKSKDKKAGKEPKKKSKAAEQRDLEMCEEEYLPLIEKLQMAKDKKDIAAIQGVLEDLLPVAESFTASFFSEYGIPETMKQTKTVLAGAAGGGDNNDLSTYRKLWNRMKQSYAEKFQQLPEGFKAKKRKSIIKTAAAPIKQESSDRGSEDEPSERASSSIVVKTEEVDTKPQVQGSPVRSSSDTGAAPDSTTDPNDRSGATSPLKVPIKEGKRRVSLGNEQQLQQQQAKKSVEKPPAPKPKEKFSILKLLPKKKESNKRLSVGGGTEKSSATPSSVPNKKTVPSWVTAPLPDKYDSFRGSDGREDRMFALEFLLQAAAHFPPNKGVNEESVARSLEGAIFEWSQGQIAQVQRGRTKWEDVYWDKVHAIVAAIAGKRDVGTLVEMIMEGSFVSPASLIKLSVEVLEHSFEGRPIVLNE